MLSSGASNMKAFVTELIMCGMASYDELNNFNNSKLMRHTPYPRGSEVYFKMRNYLNGRLFY